MNTVELHKETMPEIADAQASETSLAKCTISSCIPDTDVILFLGEIRTGIYVQWQKLLKKLAGNHKGKALVLMCTVGGNPHDAFRMMRLLQAQYKVIDVAILGGCYSAGTLFALGASKIQMSRSANLGPLDIQLRKEDDFVRISGECYRQALSDLSTVARQIFMDQFVELKSCQDILISTQTASHAAADIVKGLISPITGQIEPTKLGEMMRSQRIGISYAMRLMSVNYGEDASRFIANKLAREYPSHDTVIDYEEARKLGLNVEIIDTQSWAAGIFQAVEEQMLENGGFGLPNIKCLNDETVVPAGCK